MSPNPPDSHPTLTPRASLDSLPTEVKSRIAEMCWLHDEWWREYSAHMSRQLDGTGNTELGQFFAAQREEGRRFGTSLGSLALVSQAWAGLTAPFRFQVVKVARANRPIFRQRIAWRYLHHVHELHLDDSRSTSFDDFLSFLPAFTDVKKLVIGDKTVANFCGRTLSPSHHGLTEGELLACTDLRRLFERITSLSYTVSIENPMHELNAAASSLSSFAYRFTNVTAGKAILTTVFNTASHLDTLSIDATGLVLDFGALIPAAGTTSPTLVSLSLKAERFNPSLEAFVSPFRMSIRHLHLEWTEEPAESDDATFIFPASPAFPAFRTLELVGCGTSPLLPLLESIKPSNIPALQALEIVPRFDPEGDWGFAGTGISDDLHLLCEGYGQRRLALRYYESMYRLTPLSALEARDTFSRKGRNLVMTPSTPYPHLAFYEPEEVAYYDDLDLLKEPVADVVDFLAAWVQRVEESDSPQEYVHLARALRLVELERVAQTS